MEEAALIDGANRIQILVQILLPLSKPVIASIAVFSLLQHYNSYIEPLIYLRSMEIVQRKGENAKETWLALFADDAVIEDPIGPSPLDPEGRGHRGKEAIAAFWDLAIATVKLRFEELPPVA